MKELIKATHRMPKVSTEFESRVMCEITRRTRIGQFQRRYRMRLAASFGGLAVGLAACLAAIAMWLPVQNYAMDFRQKTEVFAEHTGTFFIRQGDAFAENTGRISKDMTFKILTEINDLVSGKIHSVEGE